MKDRFKRVDWLFIFRAYLCFLALSFLGSYYYKESLLLTISISTVVFLVFTVPAVLQILLSNN
jgi:hypothetical protein